jgi:hypothetical protein
MEDKGTFPSRSVNPAGNPAPLTFFDYGRIFQRADSLGVMKIHAVEKTRPATVEIFSPDCSHGLWSAVKVLSRMMVTPEKASDKKNQMANGS